MVQLIIVNVIYENLISYISQSKVLQMFFTVT
jgi:hypothetical protein